MAITTGYGEGGVSNDKLTVGRISFSPGATDGMGTQIPNYPAEIERLKNRIDTLGDEALDSDAKIIELTQQVAAAKDLIGEHIRAHRSPGYPAYNGCDKEECAWCGAARSANLIDEGWLTPPTPEDVE